jgi:hypothetical protein
MAPQPSKAGGSTRRDKMTQSFTEIPQQARDMAKTSIDQSRAAFDQFMAVMTGTMEAWSKGSLSNQNTVGFKAVQDRTMAFAKQNADSIFALASDVANAKDFQEVLSLQSKYAQTQMQSYALQTKELGLLSAKAMQSLKPAA